MTGEGQRPAPFSAADAALGYLYQVRLGLVCALKRLRRDQSFQISLETLDDVVFESDGEPAEILQAKHHKQRPANLTDASTDLWKTLRIWCEGMISGAIPEDAALYLVSTSVASDGHAAACLRPETRDPQRALEKLTATARSSTNRGNQKAYEAFRVLTPDQQLALIERVYVFDAAPDIVGLEGELRSLVRLSVQREHLEPFLTRLEGWWLRRAVQQLANRGEDPIPSDEFEDVMDELREQFKHDALPIDIDIFDIQVDADTYQGETFVRQVHLLEIGAQRVLMAIREYFRAVEQRSRWAREELLLIGELDRYEQRLIEEWTLVFERMRDDLGQDAAEDARIRAARAIYAWVESEVLIPIRPKVTERFITRGSYHMLADRLRVGWHPDFRERLEHLLDQPEVAS